MVIIKEEPSKNSRILISLNLNDSSLSSWESSVENLTITVFRSRPDIIEYPANINIKIYCMSIGQIFILKLAFLL